MKIRFKKIATLVTTGLLTCSLFAAAPQVSMNMKGAFGAYNLSKNPVISEIPGISDKSELDFKFGIKGGFGNEAGYHSAGYRVGGSVDLKKLLNNIASPSPAYTSDSRKTSNYTKIQKMIDWYEANKHFYGLPDNPYPNGEWPTTEYANKFNMKQFIYGTKVEDIYNVDWNETNNIIRVDSQGNLKSEDISADAAALELYNDIQRTINIALKMLYIEPEYGGVPCSLYISDAEYRALSATGKKYAQKKLEAIASFKNLSSNSPQYPIASGYIEITNMGGLFDVRADLLNSRLTAGRLITSDRARQKDYGSAFTFGIAEGLVSGLKAELTVGLAGGMSQQPENFNTTGLDYYSGKYAEIGIKLNSDYTYKFDKPALDVTVGADFMMPDLMVTPTNLSGAFRLGVHLNDHREYINEYGFYLVEPSTLRNMIEVEDNLEFTYVFTKDRYDVYDKPSFSYALRNELYFAAYGAELKFNTSFKAPKFENKYMNQVEDRFDARSAASDFKSANLKKAALFELDASYNTFRLLQTDIFTIKAGFDAFLYGTTTRGIGFNAGLECNLVDYVGKDLIIKADMNWYKNSKTTKYLDTANLKKIQFLDNAVISAGIEYLPYKNFVIGLDFVTAPSPSLRYRERITSAELFMKVSY